LPARAGYLWTAFAGSVEAQRQSAWYRRGGGGAECPLCARGVTYSRLWNASGVPRWAGVDARGSDELVALSLSLGEGERLARGRLLSRPWACGWCDCRGWNGPDRNREGKREGEMSEAGIHVTEMGDHPVDVAMKGGGF